MTDDDPYDDRVLCNECRHWGKVQRWRSGGRNEKGAPFMFPGCVLKNEIRVPTLKQRCQEFVAGVQIDRNAGRGSAFVRPGAREAKK